MVVAEERPMMVGNSLCWFGWWWWEKGRSVAVVAAAAGVAGGAAGMGDAAREWAENWRCSWIDARSFVVVAARPRSGGLHEGEIGAEGALRHIPTITEPSSSCCVSGSIEARSVFIFFSLLYLIYKRGSWGKKMEGESTETKRAKHEVVIRLAFSPKERKNPIDWS